MLSVYVPYIATAAVVSLPWFVAYRSRTGYLASTVAYLKQRGAEDGARIALLVDEQDRLSTKLAAEKFENESLANTCDMLRKANDRLAAQLAPFTAARARRGANGKFVRAA